MTDVHAGRVLHVATTPYRGPSCCIRSIQSGVWRQYHCWWWRQDLNSVARVRGLQTSLDPRLSASPLGRSGTTTNQQYQRTRSDHRRGRTCTIPSSVEVRLPVAPDDQCIDRCTLFPKADEAGPMNTTLTPVAGSPRTPWSTNGQDVLVRLGGYANSALRHIEEA